MAFCFECDEEYPDARADMLSLGHARNYCVQCASSRLSMRDIKQDLSTRLVLEHKGGYRLVRTREDVRAISTGKPTGGTTETSR